MRLQLDPSSENKMTGVSICTVKGQSPAKGLFDHHTTYGLNWKPPGGNNNRGQLVRL